MTKQKYAIIMPALLAVVAIIAVGIASAQVTGNSARRMMEFDNDDFGMMGMGGMMEMMNMMHGNFVHDQDDIDWMRKEMKEHMNLTDEEVNEMFSEMQEHCPMMRGM